MKRIKGNWLWETVGYITLCMCVFGQITVGRWYLVAQSAYLIANVASVVRDFVLELPRANKVKDVVFTAITLALIVLWIF